MSRSRTMIAIEDVVYNRALRLLTVQHAVAEMANGRKVEADLDALRDAVAQIRRIVTGIDGAYAVFVGGLAVQELGYVRWTDDIDVAADGAHYPEVLDNLIANGFERAQDHAFRLINSERSVQIDLFREGAA